MQKNVSVFLCLSYIGRISERKKTFIHFHTLFSSVEGREAYLQNVTLFVQRPWLRIHFAWCGSN